jgi:hypothetical protein
VNVSVAPDNVEPGVGLVISDLAGGAGEFTTCVTVPELAPWLASPEYAAVNTYEPAASVVVHVALPELSAIAEHTVELPVLNVTVPVGVLDPPVTAAVNVTGDPATDGFAEDVIVTAEVATSTD